MHAKLVGVPGSHPCISAELMLRYKGVEFTRLDLPNMSHKAMLPLLRYRGSTVPVMTIDGKRVSGDDEDRPRARGARARAAAVPGEDRATIEGAEAWADSVLQDGVRQLGPLRRRRRTRRRWRASSTGPLLGIPERHVRARDAGAAAGRRAADAHRPTTTAQGLPGGAARASSTASTRCWPRA